MMVRKNLSDNYLEVYKELLNKLISGPDGLAVRSREGIVQQMIACSGTNPVLREDLDSNFHIEFERAATSCTLSVKIIATGDYRSISDEHGNVWQTYAVKTSVNFPCHGAVNAATAFARLNFYMQIAAYAAEIDVEFDRRIEAMVDTAAGFASRDAKVQFAIDMRRVKSWVEENIPARMRLNDTEACWAPSQGSEDSEAAIVVRIAFQTTIEKAKKSYSVVSNAGSARVAFTRIK